MLTAQQLSAFRSTLLLERKELLKRMEVNDNHDLNKGHPHESVGELSSFDNHPADEGTELFERSKDLALLEHDRNYLNNIDKALEAIQKGTYGKCEKCSKDIPIERLNTIPTTTFCKEHSPDQLTSENRPVEEEVLTPPYGKFNFDDSLDEGITFDAEDSWQEVAQWGTSETPGDFTEQIEHYDDVNIEPDENLGYVEDYENFVGVDLYGQNLTVYPNKQLKKYEEELDEEGVMTIFGDLPGYEKEPYTEV